MSWLSKNVIAPATGLVGGLLGFGGKPGPANPYGRPDLAYLSDTSKLDFLKDPKMYQSLLDMKKYDFLKKPSPENPFLKNIGNLPGQARTFAGSYKPPNSTSDTLFQDLLGNIPKGPTSTDQVRTELNTDRLKQLLEGIDTDTKGAAGSLKMDFADRGLSGPGIGSDIEASGLAQTYGDAAKRKAGARTDFATTELAAIQEREKAAQEAQNRAYEARYGAGVASDTQGRDIASRGAMSDVASYNDLLKGSTELQAQLGEGALGRNQANTLAYADLLKSGTQDYTNATSAANNLFAQLLNARDLGAAGINSTNYNQGVENQYKYAKPGILETLLGNTKINLGFGGGG